MRFFIELESRSKARLDRTEPKRNERAAWVERYSWEATSMPNELGVNTKEIYRELVSKAIDTHGALDAPETVRKRVQRHVDAALVSPLTG